MRCTVISIVLLFAPLSARAETPLADYGWLAKTSPAVQSAQSQIRLSSRIPPPPGATRVDVKPGSFGAWLRDLPLLPPGSGVRLFNGELKARQDVHAAVVDLDVGSRDLQQCADAVMRLRAEYLYARHKPVRFHPDPGKPRELAFIRRGAPGDVERQGDRERFRRYLVGVFADAGSASLEAEMKPVGSRPLAPGDVLIQGGYPGHAVQVLDVAERGEQRFLLLGQSYMPAQQFHVVKNLDNAALSPWYDAATLATPAMPDGGLRTPEWRPFRQKDARRYSGDTD